MHDGVGGIGRCDFRIRFKDGFSQISARVHTAARQPGGDQRTARRVVERMTVGALEFSEEQLTAVFGRFQVDGDGGGGMRGNIPLYGIPVNGMRSIPVVIPEIRVATPANTCSSLPGESVELESPCSTGADRPAIWRGPGRVPP